MVDFVKLQLYKLKKESEELTTSDLQGRATVMVGDAIRKIGKKHDLSRFSDNSDIEDVYLQYVYGELDVNSAKRFIIDAINRY